MKKTISLLIGILFVGILSAQSNTTNSNENIIDPVYPGGLSEMSAFLSENLVYPEKSQKKRVEGRVLLSFIIEKNGSISHVTVEEGLDKKCNKEAIRVVKLMPNWTPGTKDGKPVRVMFKLPIRFSLN